MRGRACCRSQVRRQIFLATLGAPALLYVLAIGVWPMLQGVWYSAFDYSLLHPARRHFVGFGNYVSLFNDASFRNAFVNTVVFSLFAVVLEFAAGLGIALLLWRESRFNQVCLALLLVPVSVTPIVVGLIFKGLLEPDYGMIGYWLAHWEMSDPRGLLGSTHTALATLVLVDAWEWTPLMALILLAGLKALPLDVIEAVRCRRGHRVAAVPVRPPAAAPAGRVPGADPAGDGCVPRLRLDLCHHRRRTGGRHRYADGPGGEARPSVFRHRVGRGDRQRDDPVPRGPRGARSSWSSGGRTASRTVAEACPPGGMSYFSASRSARSRACSCCP